jgi:TonB family protein
MKTLEPWVLGYLLNSIWQVPLVFLAASAAARLARSAGPRTEHRIWVAALLLQTTLPGCDLRLEDLWRPIQALLSRSRGHGLGEGEAHAVIGAGSVHGGALLRLPPTLLAALAVAYGCTLLYFAARLGWGIARTYRMRRRSLPMTLTGDAAHTWHRLRNAFGRSGEVGSHGETERSIASPKAATAAEIAISPMISGPVTVGIRRGVLLVPPGFLEHVAEGDLTAVLAHEFAHIQRQDFLKNLLYGALSLPVSYHPLLWLTRSRLAGSREMVCDAMAADAVAGRESYARSLLRLASMLSDRTPVHTLHAIGIFDANIFERRIMNLTQKHIEMRGARRLAVAAACIAVGLATCASALALRRNVSAAAATTVSSPANPAAQKVPAQTMAEMTLYKKPPVYPREAKANKDTLDGPVVLAVIVGKDGLVEHISVQKSLRSDYDQSALEAVREWRYKPYLVNGDPTEVETTVTVTYSIQK